MKKEVVCQEKLNRSSGILVFVHSIPGTAPCLQSFIDAIAGRLLPFADLKLQSKYPVQRKDNITRCGEILRPKRRISCQDGLFPKGFGMEGKSKPFIWSAYYLKMLRRRVRMIRQDYKKEDSFSFREN
jgi:hypothetical protein